MSRSTNKKFHIVFLIDANLASYPDRNHYNGILLIVCRLLSAVRESSRRKLILNGYERINTNENDSPNDVLFKWGYKLFSSVTTLPRDKTDNASFKNLTPDQINSFESKLRDVFKIDSTELCERTEKRKSLSHPSQLFSTALTETLHDFTWSNDEIFSSPVTHQRKNHASTEANDMWCNMVFLISEAPHSEKSLRQFSNKKVVDSDVFIDSFMSPALLSEYQQNLNISVSWIDMTSQSEIDPADNWTSILQESCSKLGGKYLPRKTIIGNLPSMPMDASSSTELQATSVTPPFGLSWTPTESYILDILSGIVGESLNLQETAFSASISVSCFGLQNVPMKLIPVSQIVFSREKPDVKFALTEAEVSEASFSLVGLIQRSCVCDKLIKQVSLAFMLKSSGNCEALARFLETLEASNTLAVLRVDLKNKDCNAISVLQSQHSKHFLSLLHADSCSDLEKLFNAEIFLEEEKILPSHQNNMIDSQTFKDSVLESLYKSIEDLQDKKEQDHSVNERGYKVEEIFQSHCMNSWHIPGSTRQMCSLAEKLQDRLDKTKNEKVGLKKLKKFYAQERQPKELIQNDVPVSNAPICATRKQLQGTLGELEQLGSKSLTRGMKRRSSSVLQRGRLMVDRARSANLLAAEESSTGTPQVTPASDTPERSSTSSLGTSEMGLQTEEELQSYLRKQYEQVLSEDIGCETAVKTMVTVTSQFMSTMEFSNPQREAANFIQSHLVLTSLQLKEKYKGDSASDVTSRKNAEHKLQVMLVLETESLLRESSLGKKETLTEELVAMLRVLSFSIGATDLRLFLTELVSSYSATVPMLLVDIYDELMLTLPPALARFASPGGPSSVRTASFEQQPGDASFSSAGPGSSQPSSDSASQQARKSSRFKQHPSIADYRQKKQILVKPVLNAKQKSAEAKKSAKAKKKTKSRASLPQTRFGGECDRAKRNLFSDHKPKVNTPKAKDKKGKVHRKRHHTLSSSEKVRTLVLGTPVHKQRSGWHIQQQKKRQLKDKVQTDVQVVAESPAKDEDSGSVSTMNKPARYIVREAFYSSNSQQSRNFTKALELSQKSDGFHISESSYEKYPSTSRRSHGTLASAVRGESPMISPRSRLLKNLMTSPSPTPKPKHMSLRKASSGRSSKRLPKKLDFSDLEGKPPVASSSQPPTDNARLIFDGEDAIDFNIMKSPTKRHSSADRYREVLRTPQKQIAPSQPDMWSSASCPPPSISLASPRRNTGGFAPELTFRNVLLQNQNGNEDNSESFMQTRSPSSKRSSRQTPNKQSPSRKAFSSPELASRLRSNLFSKSPRKLTSFTECLDRDEAMNNLVSEEAPRGSKSASPTKRQRESQQGSSEAKKYVTPSTPQKYASSSHAIQCTHSTPSKVKFSKDCLISPPTGSGYPPSAEKSTPSKSILKGSPNLRVTKMPRRIQLHPVEDPVPKTFCTFSTNSNTNLQNFTQGMASKITLRSRETEKDFEKNSTHMPGLPQGTLRPCLSSETENVVKALSQSKSIKKGKQGLYKEDPAPALSSVYSKDECETARNKPASVQIRTPSPRAKVRTNSIQDWARRKKCSPKSSSSSSSSSVLSPTSSSPSYDGRVKTFLNTVAGKENEMVSDDTRQSDKGESKHFTKKRSLFHDGDDDATEMPSKRQRRNSNQYIQCPSPQAPKVSLDRDNTDQFCVATSPELFEADSDDWSTTKSSSVVPQPSDASVFSATSTSSPWKSGAAVQNRLSPSKRITRQSSDQFDEGSLGFHILVTSSTAIRRRDAADKSVPLDERGKVSSSELSSQAAEKDTPPALGSEELPPVASSPDGPGLSKRGSGSGGSPHPPAQAASPPRVSNLEKKKQYSPALSASGLMRLIKSPFVADQPPADREAKAGRSVRPKSRKHLDLS